MPVVIALCAISLLFGQSERPPGFEAVSIKPYLPKGPISEGCNPHSDPITFGRTGCTLKQLVEEAYDLKDYQVHLKGPGWVETDPFVIQARTAAPASKPEMQHMLQSVLAERFHLTIHREARDGPVYFLFGGAGKLKPASKTTGCGSIYVREGIIKSDCLTMDDLAEVLQEFVFKDRPVLNRTGAKKESQYQLKLDYSDDPATGASIFSALPDQLGLTLKAGKAPIETLVIDRAQRPEPN